MLFSPAGFEGNLSLLETFFVFFPWTSANGSRRSAFGLRPGGDRVLKGSGLKVGSEPGHGMRRDVCVGGFCVNSAPSRLVHLVTREWHHWENGPFFRGSGFPSRKAHEFVSKQGDTHKYVVLLSVSSRTASTRLPSNTCKTRCADRVAGQSMGFPQVAADCARSFDSFCFHGAHKSQFPTED